MTTRGPDASGAHFEPGLALGFRRLAVIDLTAASDQPMTNEDSSIWLVFNGEIYNFHGLRSELVQLGHQFRSSGDSEVIAHGYEQWGIEGLAKRLVGMFAIAIWDRSRRTIHLLRDHLGKKPLYYLKTANALYFASDIKAIWLAADGNLRLNAEAVDEYLYYYFITQQRTIYQGVEKLPPAHYATITADSVHTTRYWHLDWTSRTARSMQDYIDGIDEHLREATRRRLVADVPLGAFLSGGVDSSAVCAVLSQTMSERPKTFSASFAADPSLDESVFSRRVAGHIHSDHTELRVESNIDAHITEMVWQHGEPFGDASTIPSYLIARAARQHVTVVLTGDGGDEGFAGYPRYLQANREADYRWIPRPMRALFSVLAAKASHAFPESLLLERAGLFGSSLAGSREFPAQFICWWDGLRSRLYSPEFRESIGAFHPVESQRGVLASLNGKTGLERMLEYVVAVRLPSDYLAKIDVATMATSLEARCPLLDIDLLRFAASIPSEQLIAGGETKVLLKKYAATLVPPEVVYRQKKGFELPIARWLRHEWREPVGRLLLGKDSAIRPYFRQEKVRAVLEEHAARKRDHSMRIWSLLMFEIWLRIFVHRTVNRGDPVFA